MTPGFISTSFLILGTVFNCGLEDGCIEKKPVQAVKEEPVIESRQVAAEEFPEAVLPEDPLSIAKLKSIPAEVKLDVPFTSQAPFKDWSPPYDEACEEASLIMVEYYLRGAELTLGAADVEIKYLVQIENRMGWGIDISSSQVGTLANQTYRREMFRYTGGDVTVDNIKYLLADGYPVIIPAAGKDLGNPNFIGAGPPYHMIVLTGYNKDNFYTHDPGTQYGAHYQYPQNTIQNTIHEWTGSKSTIREGEKAILVLEDPRLNNYVAAYSF